MDTFSYFFFFFFRFYTNKIDNRDRVGKWACLCGILPCCSHWFDDEKCCCCCCCSPCSEKCISCSPCSCFRTCNGRFLPCLSCHNMAVNNDKKISLVADMPSWFGGFYQAPALYDLVYVNIYFLLILFLLYFTIIYLLVKYCFLHILTLLWNNI